MELVQKIKKNDTVAVALETILSGSSVSLEGRTIVAIQTIPAGHKMAICDIKETEQVIKYGYPIGFAKQNIREGEWVHTQNLITGLTDENQYFYQPVYEMVASFEEDLVEDLEEDTFEGYRRKNGTVGVRNEIWIIPTVGCVNNVATALAGKAGKDLDKAIDAVVAFPHPYGCSQLGEDQEYTRTILADLINHPNAGGVLVLGLGCENSNIQILKEYLKEYEEETVLFLNCQDVEDEMQEGLKLLEQLKKRAAVAKRETVPIKELVVGLKCGGSDGFSGITANPLTGCFSDLLISKGGTTILTEVPEMFGAETLLMDRCINKKVFDKTVSLICKFKEYYQFYDQPIYENPSPGNKAGGITTLEDKSLGCTQKSGTTPVQGVLEYGERVAEKGLNLLSAPGNDLVAATALAAAGAQIILFTTGRGTPFAAPVPTIKISSNTELSIRKKGWIDFDAGSVLEGKELPILTEELYQYVKQVASGSLVKSEQDGFHDMAIFKKGVTL